MHRDYRPRLLRLSFAVMARPEEVPASSSSAPSEGILQIAFNEGLAGVIIYTIGITSFAEKSNGPGWGSAVAIGLGLLGLIHMSFVGMLDGSVFAPDHLKVLAAVAVLLAVLSSRGLLFAPRELAILYFGFFWDWFLLAPSLFYGSEGGTPRPYAGLVVNVFGILFLLLILWTVIAALLLWRKWWLMLVVAPLQIWIGFCIMFINAGVVTNRWL